MHILLNLTPKYQLYNKIQAIKELDLIIQANKQNKFLKVWMNFQISQIKK